MVDKDEVQQNPDNKIDQDFPGFPHGQSKENLIDPKTSEDKKTAAINKTDGEKKLKHGAKDESESDGSGGAFERTESVGE